MSHAADGSSHAARPRDTIRDTIGDPVGETIGDSAGRSVEGIVYHLVPGAEKSRVIIRPPEEGDAIRTADYAAHRVRVHDARPVARRLTLDENGLALVRHKSAVTDFYDQALVERVYYPEVAALVRTMTGARAVIVFDHTLRIDEGTGRDGGPEKRDADKGDSGAHDPRRRQARAPVRNVHNDYTPKSGPQRVRDLLPADQAERWLGGRYGVINVWRPLKGPVKTAPFAVADATSLRPEDFHATDLVYRDRVGEIYEVAYHPRQRWYYVPAMQPDEALLLKCYDSAEDGPARFTAHTAFDDPTTPADAPPRESIEARVLVLYAG